jgi:hypothetical protein
MASLALALMTTTCCDLFGAACNCEPGILQGMHAGMQETVNKHTFRAREPEREVGGIAFD